MKSVVLLVLILLNTVEGIQYVRPNTTSHVECPDRPCFTLDQYIEESNRYFTTGSLFLFLPGNHSLQSLLNLTSIANISFRGLEKEFDTIIRCINRITVDNVTSLNIEGLSFIIQFSQMPANLSALTVSNSQGVTIADSTFLNGITNSLVRAMCSTHSGISIINCRFEGNVGGNGGAIIAQEGTTITITGSTFTRNKASANGSAIYVGHGTLVLRGNLMNNFSHNSGGISGGAIYCYYCTIKLMGYNSFCNNFLTGESSEGGAIGINIGTLLFNGSANFSSNEAAVGGAIALFHAEVQHHRESIVTFSKNTARYKGGGVYVKESSIHGHVGTIRFIGNSAGGLNKTSVISGAIYIYITKITRPPTSVCNISGTFFNNSGSYGSALYMEEIDTMGFKNVHARGNSGGAFGIIHFFEIHEKPYAIVELEGNTFSNNFCQEGGVVNVANSKIVRFLGNNTFVHNHAEEGAILLTNSIVTFRGPINISNNIGTSGGGGINLKQSTVTFLKTINILNNIGGSLGGGGIYSTRSSMVFVQSETLFYNNSGFIGGGLYTEGGTLTFYGNVTFSNNSAKTSGGALYASNTDIFMDGKFTFLFNSAQYGGAMYLIGRSTVTLEWSAALNTFHNNATVYGGAIYHKDAATTIQCSNVTEIYEKENLNLILELPNSYLQINSTLLRPILFHPTLNSYHDFAGKDGSFLYGGLLDRSRLRNVFPINNSLAYVYFTLYHMLNVTSDSTVNTISSVPFQLCSCNSDQIDSCTGFKNVTVYRGQTFPIHILAIGQLKSVVSTSIMASVSRTATLKLNQSTQMIPQHCSQVSYNLYSTENDEKLTLYPDGPCKSIGQASTDINVTFLPCPDAFVQSHEKCVCEERLKRYNATCEIQDEVSIVRHAGSKFWMNASYNENGSYGGLILYPSCLIEYCTVDTVSISLDSPDIQCASNRSGVLCGECTTSFSLLLGGSRCAVCSNTYLALLLPFALAGIALVIFLSFLKLTVATGTINSLILYSNIVQVNRAVFFSSNRVNPLTVFIAWMNLDLGFETCFFDGMDAYAQTWLQFVFSVYIWILISLLILSSRYSITISKLIGSNPIAVLATLLLMSYNKILKVIIDVLSSANLDYPNGKQVTVWLKDGNVPYLHSKHLILSIFTILVLVFFFLPYTIFLLLGHCLYRLPYTKYSRWLIIRIKPLLDSYYAPYKVKARYWTGFLLLVRCALYIIFSYNSLGGAKYSLLVIIIAFSMVGSVTWLSKGTYRYFFLDVIEVSIYTNLIILSASATTLDEAKKEIVAYVLVGIVFATMIGIIVYQIHLRYFAKSALWLKIRAKIASYQKDSRASTRNDDIPVHVPKSVKMVSKTVIDVREPLLEN